MLFVFFFLFILIISFILFIYFLMFQPNGEEIDQWFKRILEFTSYTHRSNK